MYTLKLNPKALEDLKAIKAYIAEALENPTAAMIGYIKTLT